MPSNNLAATLRGRPLSPTTEKAREYLALARQTERKLAERLPAVMKGIAEMAQSKAIDPAVRLQAAKYLVDRCLGAPAKRKVAPPDEPEPIDPNDVDSQLKALASNLSPSTLDAIKSLILTDLRQSGKLTEPPGVS